MLRTQDDYLVADETTEAVVASASDYDGACGLAQAFANQHQKPFRVFRAFPKKKLAMWSPPRRSAAPLLSGLSG